MTMWLFYILTGGGTHLSKFRDLCTTIGEFYHVQTIPQKPCQKILNHILNYLNAAKKLHTEYETISSNTETMQRGKNRRNHVKILTLDYFCHGGRANAVFSFFSSVLNSGDETNKACFKIC